MQASLDAKTKATRRAEQAALQKAENAEHELAVARRECERAAGDAEDRKVQLSVLVETVETLQAGTPGERSTAHLLRLQPVFNAYERCVAPHGHCNTKHFLRDVDTI